jgi:hypothetical protein
MGGLLSQPGKKVWVLHRRKAGWLRWYHEIGPEEKSDPEELAFAVSQQWMGRPRRAMVLNGEEREIPERFKAEVKKVLGDRPEREFSPGACSGSRVLSAPANDASSFLPDNQGH